MTFGFPGQFATLLTLPERPVTAMSFFTGRFRVLGSFKERQVLLVFQRPGRNRPGYLVVAMQTTAPSQSIVQPRVDGSAAPDRDLERALFVLEGKHAMRLDVADGWLRVAWMPAGFTIFPGPFDASKWSEVLENMHVTVERLEAREPALLPAPPATVAPDWHVGITGTPFSLERPRGVFIIKTVGGLLCFAGFSMLTAALPLAAMDATSVTRFTRSAALLGAILLVTGAATWYVSARSSPLTLNEDEPDAGAVRTAFGGWLWLLLATLVLLPIWMLGELRPLVSLWRDMLIFLDRQEVWNVAGAGQEMSGLVLIPVFAVLFVPALDAAVAAGVALGAVLLVGLLATRSPRFPRAYLAFAILVVGLVVASEVATGAALEAGRLIEGELDASAEALEARAFIARYGQVLHASATALLVVAIGFGLWTPALFTSRRIRTTFAPLPTAAGRE